MKLMDGWMRDNTHDTEANNEGKNKVEKDRFLRNERLYSTERFTAVITYYDP